MEWVSQTLFRFRDFIGIVVRRPLPRLVIKFPITPCLLKICWRKSIGHGLFSSTKLYPANKESTVLREVHEHCKMHVYILIHVTHSGTLQLFPSKWCQENYFFCVLTTLFLYICTCHQIARKVTYFRYIKQPGLKANRNEKHIDTNIHVNATHSLLTHCISIWCDMYALPLFN